MTFESAPVFPQGMVKLAGSAGGAATGTATLTVEDNTALPVTVVNLPPEARRRINWSVVLMALTLAWMIYSDLVAERAWEFVVWLVGR